MGKKKWVNLNLIGIRSNVCFDYNNVQAILLKSNTIEISFVHHDVVIISGVNEADYNKIIAYFEKLESENE